MANAKEELIGTLNRIRIDKDDMSISIKCAHIYGGPGHYYWDDNDNYITKDPILLKEGYTPAEYEEFLAKLDFKYDSGYGGQELFGTVWLTEENTWLERGEYDGSEWWEYKKCPSILDELKKK